MEIKMSLILVLCADLEQSYLLLSVVLLTQYIKYSCLNRSHHHLSGQTRANQSIQNRPDLFNSPDSDFYASTWRVFFINLSKFSHKYITTT